MFPFKDMVKMEWQYDLSGAIEHLERGRGGRCAIVGENISLKRQHVLLNPHKRGCSLINDLEN